MEYCSRVQVQSRGELLVETPNSPVTERRQTSVPVIRIMKGNCAPSPANLTSCARQSKLVRNSLHWEEFFGNLEFLFIFFGKLSVYKSVLYIHVALNSPES